MKAPSHNELLPFLNECYHKYNRVNFIEADPVSIPHRYHRKEDIEIAGFLAATLAWGNRKSILHNAGRLLAMMGESPHDFVCEHRASQLNVFESFVHRTFNGQDCVFFIKALRHLYIRHGGLEAAFGGDYAQYEFGLKQRIVQFRNLFLEVPHLSRSEKHLSNPAKKSSSKRLCMFLRWMVRQDKKGVDFGIWKNIRPSELCLPLDVHTGSVGRALGLLSRKQNDWEAVEEITRVLRDFDPKDPVKYDFALFGLGVEGFLK